MFRSVLEERAFEVERQAIALAAAAADPDDVPAAEAMRVYERLDRAARAVAAAKTLLARRVDDSREWQRRGYRSAAEHLAATAGTSVGAARDELDTSKALPGLPKTRQALIDGELSPAQGAVVAGAAKVNPKAEGRLIRRARKATLRDLKDDAARAKAAADPDPDATRDRIHRERRAATGTDAEGAFTLHARGTIDAGAAIKAELERLTDEVFRARAKSGSHDERPAYMFDALAEMARRSSGADHAPTGAGRQARPQRLALLRLDVSALWRGHTTGDELCEVTGLGPIPVRVARRLLGDAVLKLIITKGVDVANVTSLTRGPTQAMRYATLWTSPTCSVEGCDRTIVEYDHVHGAEYRDTRHTRLDELEPKCPGHHDLHTLHGWERIRGPGNQPMVPPRPPPPPRQHRPTRQARRCRPASAQRGHGNIEQEPRAQPLRRRPRVI